MVGVQILDEDASPSFSEGECEFNACQKRFFGSFLIFEKGTEKNNFEAHISAMLRQLPLYYSV
jgi:hypothetical protein